MPRYVLGVVVSIVAGLAFAVSSLVQKKAISRLGTAGKFFRSLIKSPLWLFGFAMGYFVGGPLNLLGYIAIGPTLTPALGSIGLALVPLLAERYLGEHPGKRTHAGAYLIAGGIIVMATSGVSIQTEGVAWADPSFLLRWGIALGALAGIAVGGYFLSKRSDTALVWPLALSSGIAQALASALLAPLAAQAWLIITGDFGMGELALALGAIAALVASNLLAIGLTQLALRKGSAAGVIPFQQLPIQAVPLILHAAVYRGSFGSAHSAIVLAGGFTLVMVGSLVLDTQLRIRAPDFRELEETIEHAAEHAAEQVAEFAKGGILRAREGRGPEAEQKEAENQSTRAKRTT